MAMAITNTLVLNILIRRFVHWYSLPAAVNIFFTRKTSFCAVSRYTVQGTNRQCAALSFGIFKCIVHLYIDIIHFCIMGPIVL